MKKWMIPLGVIAGSMALFTGPATAQMNNGTGTSVGTDSGTMNSGAADTGSMKTTDTGTGAMDNSDGNRNRMDNRRNDMNNTRTMGNNGTTTWNNQTGHMGMGWKNNAMYNQEDYKPGYGEDPLTSFSLPRVDTRNNSDVASTLAGSEWRLRMISGQKAMNYPNTKLKFNEDASSLMAFSTLHPIATTVSFEGNRMMTGVVQNFTRFTDNQSDPGGESFKFLKGIESARSVEMRGNHLVIHSYGLPRPMVFERMEM